MEKKGSVSLTVSLIAGAIIAIILLVIFLIPKFRIFMVGLLFLIAGIYIAISGEFTRRKSIFALMFIAIGILVFLFQGVLQQTMFGGGLTINSVSKNVDVISSDTDLTGVWWLVNANVGGLSGGLQSIVGTLTPTQTQQFTGYSTVYPLTITASGIEEKAEYKISNTGTQVKNIDYLIQLSDNGWISSTGDCKTYGLFSAKPNNAPACPSGYNSDIRIDVEKGKNNFGRALTNDYYTCVQICWKETQVGVLGDIQPTRVTDKFDVTLSANGKTQTQTLTSDDRHKDYVFGGQLLATADYPSNSVTGNVAPLATSYKAYYDMVQYNRWALTSASYYSDYLSKYSTVKGILQTKYGANVKICTGDASCSFATPLAMINDFKAQVATVSSAVIKMKDSDLSITQDQTWGSRSDLNNGKLIINLDRQINVPILNLKVRADWLGIKIDVGKPSITSINCQEFTAGTTSQITASVKNIGTADGNFISSLNCGTVKQTYTQSSFQVNAGKTVQITVPIDAGTSTGGISDNCVLTVTDTAKSSNLATKSVTCKVDKPVSCVEGDFYNENNCIKKCVGGAVKELKCCGSGSILYLEQNKGDEFGGYYCSADSCGNKVCEIGETPTNCPEDCIEPVPCEEKTPKWLGWTEVTVEKQSIWTRIAPSIFKPKTETYCKATNAPYIFGGVLAFIIGLTAVLIIPKKNVKGKSTKFGKIGK